MIQMTFEKYHPHLFIQNLAQQIGLKSKTDCLEEILDLSGAVGEGKVTGFLFSDGIGLVLFNCLLQKDWELNFKKSPEAPLLFCFNVEGQIWHTLNQGDLSYHLNPLQGSITACSADSNQVIKIPGERQVTFAALVINREQYLKKIDCLLEEMPDKLGTIFADEQAEKTFFYQGNYSISSAQCINKIINDNNEGLVRSTFIEAKVLELLSKQVRQFNDDLRSPGKQVMIRKYDIEKIKLAKDTLIENLQKPPTIAHLAKEVGINQQKLKSGFKIIYESTINQYLSNERLEKASLFLLKGYSVRETASEVGYSNLSHFAKKFKDKYGVLPSEYAKRIQLQNTVNQ